MPRPARRRPAGRARARAPARCRRAGAGRPRTGAGSASSARGPMPDELEQLAGARVDRRPRGTIWCTRSSSPSAWRTVMRGLSDEKGSWKIIWMRRPRGSLALRGERRTRNEELPRRRLVEADDAAAERRLAAARLADEAERLARRDLEVDAVDGPQDVAGSSAADRVDDAPLSGKCIARPAHLEQRLIHRDHRLPLHSRRRARSGCTRSRGRRRSAISGELAGRAVGAARSDIEGGSGSPTAARRDRAASPGSTSASRARRSKSGTDRRSAECVRVARLAEHVVDRPCLDHLRRRT